MERNTDNNIDNNSLTTEDVHILKYNHEELETLLDKIDKGFMITEEQYQALLDRGYFGGDYNDLSNKPFIPTDTSDLTNYANFVTQNDLTAELNKFFTQLVTEEIEDQVEKAIKALDFTDLDIGDLNDSQGLLIPMDIIQNAINGAIGALQGITKLSQLLNDCDFVDEEELEEKINYVVEQIENLFIPTHLSQLIDDTGHITKATCKEWLLKFYSWIETYVPSTIETTLASKNYVDKFYVDQTVANSSNYLEIYLQSQINGKADKLDISELKQWIHNKNYVTKVEIINGYLGGELSEVNFTKKYEQMLRDAYKHSLDPHNYLTKEQVTIIIEKELEDAEFNDYISKDEFEDLYDDRIDEAWQHSQNNGVHKHFSGSYNDLKNIPSNLATKEDIKNEIKTEIQQLIINGTLGSGGGETILKNYTNTVRFNTEKSSIAIGIPEFNPITDLLDVHYNGLLLIENVHYTIDLNTLSIVSLGAPWNTNKYPDQQMVFNVLANEDANGDNTLVQNRYNFYLNAPTTEIDISSVYYDSVLDVIEIHLNGLLLLEGIDYTYDKDNKKIIKVDTTSAWNPNSTPNMKMNIKVFKNNAAGGGSIDPALLAGYQLKEDGNLTTTDKTVVGAINEIHNNMFAMLGLVGDIDLLETNATNIIDALNEVYHMKKN